MDPSTLLRALHPFEGTPYLTLTLVLDRAPSMELWRRTVDDLREALGQAPFEALRVQTVDTSAPGPLPTGDTGTPPPGKQVVLLVSNLVEAAWRDGRAAALLDHWCRTGATAVLQPLPPGLRHHVGVRLAPFQWRARLPATPTAWLECDLQPGSLEVAAGLHAPSAVPVLDLEDSRSVENWARLVAGPTTDGYEGHGIPSGMDPGTWDGFTVPAPATDPAALIETLREVAGTAAVRLAVLLTVSPLVTLHLMYAMQRRLLPEADEAVPEVLHSGLLVRAAERDRDVDPQYAYVLLDGAAELLDDRLTHFDRRRARDLAMKLLPPAVSARNTRPDPSSVLRGERARSPEPTRHAGPGPLRVRTALPARNRRFTGRGKLLADIHATLHRPDGNGLCVLHGTAGIGKTQVALEYAHSHCDEYDFVWWSEARDARSLAESLARLGAELSVPPGPDGRVPVTAVLDRLCSARADRGWLLVLNNADPPARLAPLPPLGAGHLLVTSRHVSWTEETAHPLHVKGLGPKDSLALLRVRAPWLTEDEGAAVAERTGGLPPLLVHLGHSLAKGPLDVTEHLANFAEICADLLEHHDLPDYDVNLAGVWKQAVAELDADTDATEDGHAPELLRVLSCLGTGPVSFGLLSAATGLRSPAADGGVLRDKVRLHKALLLLAAKDLVAYERGGPVEVHPVLQMVMRSVVMTRNQFRLAEKAALGLLSAALPADPTTSSGRDRMAEVARRLSLATAVDAGPEATGKLVTAVIRHHAAVGDTRLAVSRARIVLESWSRLLDTEHPLIAFLRTHAGTPPGES
ncbi:ATP-binding protein [Streptomyces humi]|uniref:ATP-binding protein n=1 Tax=Streptomyces humi TaxID=1428620 RepID=UPI0006289581|nr:ATP-binding protein [Streptomyces humi]